MNEHFKEINGNKHLTFVSTNDSGGKIKKKNCGLKSEI